MTSMSEPRFIVDTMLGNIARWLRILGYDTLYRRDFKDWEILNIASRENRVIITRDTGLHRRALNKGIKSIYLAVDDIAERLAYIALLTGIRLYVDLEKSRCPLCNGELRKVSKEKVKDRVPPRVYRFYSDFWICTRCGKVYWLGSHWVKIEEILEKARQLLDEYKSRSVVKGVFSETRSSERS
ncbi:MAG: Mut7-C RNAse domain-containing protein [Thermoprotei archaeon]